MTPTCRYPCDEDCDASCHQDHVVSWRRDPAQCAGCKLQARTARRRRLRKVKPEYHRRRR